MIEQEGNLWGFRHEADALVITTNGTVRKDGCAVMGRGVALQAKSRYPGVDESLGRKIKHHGNVVQIVTRKRALYHDRRGRRFFIVAFPVKHSWWEKADIDLIKESAHQLVALATEQRWDTVVLPRPGCGNGQLDWDDVWPVLEDILDDRFTVVFERGHGE